MNLKQNLKDILPSFVLEKAKLFRDRKVFSDRRAFYKTFLGKHKLFFDIGANVGDKTEIFSGLGIKVIAVEPQSECLTVLKKRFENNSEVIILGNGISDKKETLTLNVCSSSNVLSTFSADWKKGRFKDMAFDTSEQVKMITLEDLVREYGIPDFCKIDVEGFELKVLSGLKTKIPCLNFEYTNEYFENVEKCVNVLTSIGFQEFNFTVADKLKLKSGTWLPAGELVGIVRRLCTRITDLWGDVYAR